MNQQDLLQPLNQLYEHIDDFLCEKNHAKPKTNTDRLNGLTTERANNNCCIHCIIGLACSCPSHIQDRTIAEKMYKACQDDAIESDMLDDNLFEAIEAALLHEAFVRAESKGRAYVCVRLYKIFAVLFHGFLHKSYLCKDRPPIWPWTFKKYCVLCRKYYMLAIVLTQEISIRRRFARFLRMIRDLEGATEQYVLLLSYREDVEGKVKNRWKSEVHCEYAEFLWKYKKDYRECINQCDLAISLIDSFANINKINYNVNESAPNEKIVVWYHKARALCLLNKQSQACKLFEQIWDELRNDVSRQVGCRLGNVTDDMIVRKAGEVLDQTKLKFMKEKWAQRNMHKLEKELLNSLGSNKKTNKNKNKNKKKNKNKNNNNRNTNQSKNKNKNDTEVKMDETNEKKLQADVDGGNVVKRLHNRLKQSQEENHLLKIENEKLENSYKILQKQLDKFDDMKELNQQLENKNNDLSNNLIKLKQQLKKEKKKLSTMHKQMQLKNNDYIKLNELNKLLEKQKNNLEKDLIELKQQYESRVNMLENEKKQLMNNNVVKENNNLFEFNFIQFDKWCDQLNVSMSKLESNCKNGKEMVVDNKYIDFMTDFVNFERAFRREKEKIQVLLIEIILLCQANKTYIAHYHVALLFLFFFVLVLPGSINITNNGVGK